MRTPFANFSLFRSLIIWLSSLLRRLRTGWFWWLIALFHDLYFKKNITLKLDFEKAYDCVQWSFLQDVLLARGFDGAYEHRIMQLVSGGHTAVSINGHISPFFPSGRGGKAASFPCCCLISWQMRCLAF